MKLKKVLVASLLILSFSLSGCNFDVPSGTSEYVGSLYIAQKPKKTLYALNDTFSLEGLKVIDTKSGSTITNYSSSLEEGTVLNTVGKEKVDITLTSYKPTSFEIEVVDFPRLRIASYPKQSYEFGEAFTSSGLQVTSIVNDEEITINDYQLNYRNGTPLTEAGTFDVAISKEGYISTSYQINVRKEKRLSVYHLPNKTSYLTGENFNTDGLIIHNENDQVVNDYSLSIKDGSNLKYAGNIDISVTKDGYVSTSFTIEVTENSSLPTKERDLKIYYLNDTHGSFIRQIDEGNKEAGMSYISSYIKSKVEEDPSNSLVLSGGDMFQGGYESNMTRGEIMIDAMNEIGFDAMALGNHEFDWGEDALVSISQKLNCDIISANTFYSDDEITRPSYIKPYTIITKGDLKVGIIGAAKDNMGSSITGSISDDFYFPNPVSYIKEYSDELRLNHNCDIIIASFHEAGYESDNGEPSQYSSLTSISNVSGARYVDAMLFAHDHRVKYGTYNDVPYMEAGKNGMYLGEMTLSLSGTTSYSVESSDVRVINAYNNCTTPDPKIEALASKYSSQIGNPDQVVYNFKNSYDIEEFTVVLCKAMYWYVNSNISLFGNERVYFSSHNTGGVRTSVSPGNMTMRNLIKVYPFENELCIQTCTANNISRLRNSSYYRTYEADNIVFTGNYTKAVTITYIAEYRYAYNYQQSYIKYTYVARDALIAYLTSGVDNTL